MNKEEQLIEINQFVKNTLIDFLDITYTNFGPDFIEATAVPVTEKTHNPARILHGGAMMALAESLGSALSLLLIDRYKQDVRGLEINGNHVKSTTKGTVSGKATLIHKGRHTHVSEIKIYDEEGKLLNISRMTNMIIEKND